MEVLDLIIFVSVFAAGYITRDILMHFANKREIKSSHSDKNPTLKELALLGIILGMFILVLGATFNFEALSSNGGFMPVKVNYDYKSDSHFSYQENSEVNNWFFTDFIELDNSIWSIGDFFLIFGFIVQAMFLLNYVYLHHRKEIKKYGSYFRHHLNSSLNIK